MLNVFKMLVNCHSQEEPKETQQVNVTWYPGCDAGTQKGHQRETDPST